MCQLKKKNGAFHTYIFLGAQFEVVSAESRWTDKQDAHSQPQDV